LRGTPLRRANFFVTPPHGPLSKSQPKIRDIAAGPQLCASPLKTGAEICTKCALARFNFVQNVRFAPAGGAYLRRRPPPQAPRAGWKKPEKKL